MRSIPTAVRTMSTDARVLVQAPVFRKLRILALDPGIAALFESSVPSEVTLPVPGLELMTSEELSAMLPVERAMAKKQDWNMPFPSLFRRLEERTQGRMLDRDDGVNGRGTPLARKEWAAFERRTDVKKDWIDYHVDP